MYLSRICTCITWLWWFDFRLEPISDNNRATPKNVTLAKSGPKWNKNNHLTILTEIQSISLIHYVEKDCICDCYFFVTFFWLLIALLRASQLDESVSDSPQLLQTKRWESTKFRFQEDPPPLPTFNIIVGLYSPLFNAIMGLKKKYINCRYSYLPSWLWYNNVCLFWTKFSS